MSATTPATEAPTPAPPPAWLFKLVNPVMRALLRSPLHRLVSGRLALLAFAGRRSGRRYAFPIAYVRVGDTLLIGTEKAWKANLRGHAPVTVRLAGADRAGVATVIEDEAGLFEAYRTILAKNPDFARFVGVRTDAAGTPDRADVARAARAGHAVVRIELA